MSSTALSLNSESERIYDVFLSFRGPDTRKKFTDHLYEALRREGFRTFRDDDGIEKGENIRSELLKAIPQSRMSVIVLSQNYSKSKACLSEMQTILQHRKTKRDHFVLPVFYEVDPLDIKEQARNLDFGEEKVEVVKGWAMALEEVSNMAGMVSLNQSNGYEAEFIKEILGEIRSKLSGKHLQVAASKGNIEKKYLEEISVRTFRWLIKVKVINIVGPSFSKDGKTTYKRFMLLDEKGKKIDAVMYGKTIETFRKTLELHKTYQISRGRLKKVDTKHKRLSPDEHECQITFTDRSIIEEVEHEAINPVETKMTFMPLRYIPELKSLTSIDIVAIVLGISQEENRKRKRDQLDVTSRDIFLVDSSLQTTTLTARGKHFHNVCDTLANMLQKRPIIVASNLQLRGDGKECISTSQYSEIFINLEIPEVKQLEAWKLENENVLENIPSQSSSSSTSRTITIQQILNTADMDSIYQVKASVTTILQQEQCWYTACKSCHKKTDQPIGATFACYNCGKPSVTAEPWLPRVCVELGDSTGNLPATLFGTHAEKILACEANQFVAHDIEEQYTLLEKWTDERTEIDYIFHVKLARETRGTMSLKIMKVEDAK